jgi:hypothetical protein
MLSFLQAKHDLDFKAKEKLAILQRETDEFKNQSKTQKSNVIFLFTFNNWLLSF